MSYTATVLTVMLASPSDLPDARNAIEKAVHGWNDANARHKNVVLQPWRWETAAVPLLGEHPQSLLNAQGVDRSDVVFAMFGGRLGSATPEAISGTVAEIERAVEAKKPVHLYFSTAPLPADVDTEQLEAVRAFKRDMEGRGLLGEFSNVSQLEHEVWKAIESDIVSLGVDAPEASSSRVPAPGVNLVVQPRQERELSGHNKSGSPRYSTRHWLEVENRGGEDAKDVTFTSLGESGLLIPGNPPTTIHAGQVRRVTVLMSMGGSDPEVVRVTWTENGEVREKDFHVS